MQLVVDLLSFFFFNDTATTEIYTLSLHDALPIYREPVRRNVWGSHHQGQNLLFRLAPALDRPPARFRLHHQRRAHRDRTPVRSEEHTSELQSQSNLVCRLLLEKKKKHETHIRIRI